MAPETQFQDTSSPKWQRPCQPQTCYFLRRLPLELRESIYAYWELGRPTYTQFILRARGNLAIDRVGFQKPPALSWVCRQIRTEVFSIWYGRNVVEVTLDDEIALDGLYLRNCLRHIGEGMPYIRCLVVRHKVDSFLYPTPSCPVQKHRNPPMPTALDAVSEWRESHFRVQENGSIEAECKAATTPHFGATCVCPLSKRLRNVHVSTLEGFWDCPLSRALHAFLCLVEQESFDMWDQGLQPELGKIRGGTEGSIWDNDPVLRFYCGLGHYPLDRLRSNAGWPTCPTCGLRQWMLQGPKVDCHRARWAKRGVWREGKTLWFYRSPWG